MRASALLPLAFALALAAGLPARAQEPSPPAGPGGAEAPPATPPQLHGVLTLSLAEAISMGIENNLDVQVSRYEPLVASETAEGAWGAFDPELFADYGYSKTETPNTNPLLESNLGSDQEELTINRDRLLDGQAGLRGLVPKLGASYEIGYQGQRTTYSSGFFPLSPEYRTQLRATASIPLMKGLLWNEPWLQVQTTRILEDSAREEFRRALMDTTSAIESAYWSLVAADEGLRVAVKSLETAQALLEQTRAQYEVGVVSRVEVVESEAGVADRLFRKIQVQNTKQDVQDQLIDLVLGPYLQPGSDLEIRPADQPEPLPYEVDPEEAAKLALGYRPELATVRQEIDRRELLLKFARNQRLPQLDVVAGAGVSGLSGDSNSNPRSICSLEEAANNGGTCPRWPEFGLSDRYFHSDDTFFDPGSADSWSVRGVLSVPIGNRKASSDARVADLELRKAHTQLRRLEQSIILEIRNAVRGLRSTREGIDAAEQRRRATEEQLRAERIRLEHGESTPFEVLDRESDLVEAERQKILALRDHREALTALDRAQGTILRNRNIVVEDASALR